MEGEKEYMDRLKEYAKKYIDEMDAEGRAGRKALFMVCGFARRCFLESRKSE